MPHFIKTGYWEKAVKNYKGWLDLEQLIGSSSVINSGGGTSLGSGNGLPSGQVYGRFFFDTGDSSFYFDDGNTWNEIGGGTTLIPNLEQVLTIGNFANNYIYLQGETANFIQGKSVLNFSNQGASTISTYYSFDTSATYNLAVVNYNILLSFRHLQNINNTYNNILWNNIVESFFEDFGNCNINYNNTIFNQRNTLYFTIGNNSTINFNSNVVNLLINENFGFAFTGNINFNNRIGILLQVLRNGSATYNGVNYGIWDQGNDIRFDGKLYLGTSTNLATTNVAMSIGKPINYENSTTSSAGSASGEYLTVYINGVQRKIALLNP